MERPWPLGLPNTSKSAYMDCMVTPVVAGFGNTSPKILVAIWKTLSRDVLRGAGPCSILYQSHKRSLCGCLAASPLQMSLHLKDYMTLKRVYSPYTVLHRKRYALEVQGSCGP